MTKEQRAKAERMMEDFSRRAQDFADQLDPDRKRSHKDETTRTLISACDQITAQSSRALSMLRVTA